MMGKRCIFEFCFQVRGLVFLQRTMINDESNVLPFVVVQRYLVHGYN